KRGCINTPLCGGSSSNTGNNPIYSSIGNWFNHDYISSDEEHEEPCEMRVSRTVLWEGRGEIPLPDPIMCHNKTTFEQI
ncbi:MAG: hypothetical protein ACK5XN_10135, partial [Bacteroidota bacterium]